MAYQVLARKYRPLRFSDVVGQDHVTRTLLNALAQDRIAHGYIFSGHRGIGKTTIARILASALNCRNAIGSELRPTPEPCLVCDSCLEIRQGNAVDVIEIDAATNRGIDEIRELRDAARYAPARDKYKIYILDEAHQITDAAFNALLKTLEEPPPHIVFMMATTQPEDIPQTIRSRCQHFSFHAVKLDDIVGQLSLIAKAEHILADAATLSLLAEAGDGSMRDALSIMDQAIASAPLVQASDTPGSSSNTPGAPSETPGSPFIAPPSGAMSGVAQSSPHLELSQIRELMGSVSNVVYEQILEAVHANNSADVLAITGRLLDAGNGAPQLARQFVRYLRNTIVAKVTGLSPDPGTEAAGQEISSAARDLLQISEAERNRAARSATLFTEEELSRFLAIMLRTFDDLGYRQEQRFHLELGLLKLVHLQRLVPIEELLSQLGVNPTSTPITKPSVPSFPAASSPAQVGSIATNTPAAVPSRFDTDRTRKTPTASASGATSPATTDGSLALADRPEPAPSAEPRPHLVAASPAPDLSSRPKAAPFAAEAERPAILAGEDPLQASPTLDLAALQHTLAAALAAVKGQQSASEQIEDATLTLAGDQLQVQTTLSKTMLPVVLNAEAQRILQAALRDHATPGAPPLKLALLPGAPASSTGTAVPRTPRAAASGSAAELAEKHPIVQEARRIFSADISNVIDLRDKN